MNVTCITQRDARSVDEMGAASDRPERRRLGASGRVRGFTLLELVVTITIGAVLVLTGVPSFLSFVQNNRATTDTNDLVTALNLARNTATQRGAIVSVCSSSNGATCTSDVDWSSGWIVLGPGNEILRSWPARSAAGVLVGNAGTIQFQPRGSAAAASLFQVRVPSCTGNQGRDVRVNVAGRVAVTRVNCV